MLLQQQTFSKNIYLWWKSLKWKFSLKSLHFSRKICDLFSIFSCPKIVIQYPIFHGKYLFRRFLQTYCQIIHSPKILFRRENHLETKTFVNSLLRFGTQTFSVFQNSKLLKTCNFANSWIWVYQRKQTNQKHCCIQNIWIIDFKQYIWLEMILKAKLNFVYGLIKGSNLQNIRKCVLQRSISQKKTLRNRNETMNSLLLLQGSSMALMATISRFSHHISWHAWNDNDWGW